MGEKGSEARAGGMWLELKTKAWRLLNYELRERACLQLEGLRCEEI